MARVVGGPRPLGGRVPHVVVVVPALNCQATLDVVLTELPPTLTVVVVDDGSTPALTAPGRILVRHPTNRGYGAAQKSGYTAALAAGADEVVLVHGDGQYHLADTLALTRGLATAHLVLGSRFLADPSVIPAWRRLGNRALTTLANVFFVVRHTELHTGARAYRASFLRDVPYDILSDDYVFDQQLIAWALRGGRPIAEQAVRAKYDRSTQSIRFGRALVYGLGCVQEILRP